MVLTVVMVWCCGGDVICGGGNGMVCSDGECGDYDCSVMVLMLFSFWIRSKLVKN